MREGKGKGRRGEGRGIREKEKREEEDGKSVERTEAGRSTPKERNARAKKRARAYFDPPE